MPEPSTTKKSPSPSEARRTHPYFDFQHNAIDAILKAKLNGVSSRILIFAMQADRGKRGKIHMGLNGIVTATGAGKNRVVEGLRELVAKGFLIKINDLGDYRLGTMFDKFVSEDTVPAIGSVHEPHVLPVNQCSPDSYSSKMHFIWRELKDIDRVEADMGKTAIVRAEKWAAERVHADSDPLTDFRKSVQYFLEHGHELPLKGGKPRSPMAYDFRGFMNVCQMFLQLATAAEAKAVASNTQSGANSIVPAALHESFISGQHSDGSFMYREGAVSSSQELAAVLEHAFGQVGEKVKIIGNKKTEERCEEDFAAIFQTMDISRIVDTVRFAKSFSESDEYFAQRPFTYHTARTLFSKVQALFQRSGNRRAEAKAKEQRQIESGERREEHLHSLRLALSYIAYDITAPGTIRDDHLKMLNQTAIDIEKDYGRPRPEDLPQDITDGLWCLSIFFDFKIPESLTDAIGTKPLEPVFDWANDDRLEARLYKMWLSRLDPNVIAAAE